MTEHKPTTNDCIEWLQTRGFLSYEERDFNKAIRDKLIAAKMMKEALEQYTQCVSSVNDPNDFTPRIKDEGEAARQALEDWGATE